MAKAKSTGRAAESGMSRRTLSREDWIRTALKVLEKAASPASRSTGRPRR